MVLTIKLRDDIWVSSDDKAILWNSNYEEARRLLTKRFNIFGRFGNNILQNITQSFNPIECYNSYYLVDGIEIAKCINSCKNRTDNFLNYFGLKIKKYPSIEQFTLLEKLRKETVITDYWVEGNVHNNQPVASNREKSEIPNANHYINEFDLTKKKNRGRGATLITFEADATNDANILKQINTYLRSFLKQSSLISIVGEDNQNSIIKDFFHQCHSLGTVFAKSYSRRKIKLIGIAPKANLIVCSVRPLENNDEMGMVRKKLIELNKSDLKNAVLLFEFETSVPFDNNVEKSVFYPINIYKDIAELLKNLKENKNFIIILGSGNGNINFDVKVDRPWIDRTQTYHDLSINSKSVIMVGATTKDLKGSFVKEPFNQSDNLDAYLYTDFNTGVPLNNHKGTSAAAAIAGGVITYLQGKAIQKGKILTLEIVKEVFKNTFMKNYPKVVLSPTTLQQLWEECEKQLKSSQHQ